MDLGCGDGVFFVEIVKRVKNTVIGCDLSSNRIYTLKEVLRRVDLGKRHAEHEQLYLPDVSPSSPEYRGVEARHPVERV